MFILFSGVPGTGKSLHAAQCMFDTLKKTNKAVIANFEINPNVIDSRNFYYMSNLDITPESLWKFSNEWYKTHTFSENGILLVVDECQLIFNCRDTGIGMSGTDGKSAFKRRMQWVEFFSQHRKAGYQIIGIAQNDRMVDRQIRACIEMECNHRNLSRMGLLGKLCQIFFVGGKFLASWRYYGVRQITDQEIVRGNKKLYAFYDSFGTFAREKYIKGLEESQPEEQEEEPEG